MKHRYNAEFPDSGGILMPNSHAYTTTSGPAYVLIKKYFTDLAEQRKQRKQRLLFARRHGAVDIVEKNNENEWGVIFRGDEPIGPCWRYSEAMRAYLPCRGTQIGGKIADQMCYPVTSLDDLAQDLGFNWPRIRGATDGIAASHGFRVARVTSRRFFVASPRCLARQGLTTVWEIEKFLRDYPSLESLPVIPKG